MKKNFHRSSYMLLTIKYLTDILMKKLSGQIHDMTGIEHDWFRNVITECHNQSHAWHILWLSIIKQSWTIHKMNSSKIYYIDVDKATCNISLSGKWGHLCTQNELEYITLEKTTSLLIIQLPVYCMRDNRNLFIMITESYHVTHHFSIFILRNSLD